MDYAQAVTKQLASGQPPGGVGTEREKPVCNVNVPLRRRSHGRCAARPPSASRLPACIARASRIAAAPRRARRAPQAAQTPRQMLMRKVLRKHEAGLAGRRCCSRTFRWVQLAGPCKKNGPESSIRGCCRSSSSSSQCSTTLTSTCCGSRRSTRASSACSSASARELSDEPPTVVIRGGSGERGARERGPACAHCPARAHKFRMRACLAAERGRRRLPLRGGLVRLPCVAGQTICAQSPCDSEPMRKLRAHPCEKRAP